MTKTEFEKAMHTGPSMRAVWIMVGLLTVLAVVTLASAGWELVAERGLERRISQDVREHRVRDRAHICRSFLGQRSIDMTLRDLAEQADLVVTSPPIVADAEIRGACREAGIELG